jgi:hypothetical protein
MKVIYPFVFASLMACVFPSCKRIQIAEINVPFTLDFEAPVASKDTAFVYELVLNATDYPEFNNNKDRLQTLSLTGATLFLKEVRAGEGTVVNFSLYVADTARNYRLLTEVNDYELRAGNKAYSLILDDVARGRLAEWLRATPHKAYIKILGTASSTSYDATFRIDIEVNQKVKVLI